MTRQMSPQYFDLLVKYLRERHLIFMRRQSGAPAPWTTDPIFLTYKFTNVLRNNDRTTRWAIANLYSKNRDASFESQAINAAMFRYFGTIEFASEIGWLDTWDPEKVLSVANRMSWNGQKLFTAAYVITNGGISAPKQEVVVNHYLDPFSRQIPSLVKIARETKSWQAVSEKLQGMPGFGPFMSKEVCLDMILLPLLEDCTDRLTWSPAGPGAVRGLNRLFNRPIDQGLNQTKAQDEMKWVLARLAETDLEQTEGFPRFGVEYGVTDVQFALCELDKYSRVVNQEGKPKARFKPNTSPLPAI